MDDLLISFSTTGPDCYADGNSAMSGETYALVWSKDKFSGMNANFTPANTNDRIVLKAPLCAKDPKTGHMHCPNVLFQVDRNVANELAGGSYGVVLCDTRNIYGQSTGKYVNSTILLGYNVKVNVNNSQLKSSYMPQFSDIEQVEGEHYVESNIETPIIKSISIVDSTITIEASPLSPICSWTLLKATESLSQFDFDELAIRTKSGFNTVKTSQSAFFKIAGERNYPIN